MTLSPLPSRRTSQRVREPSSRLRGFEVEVECDEWRRQPGQSQEFLDRKDIRQAGKLPLNPLVPQPLAHPLPQLEVQPPPPPVPPLQDAAAHPPDPPGGGSGG